MSTTMKPSDLQPPELFKRRGPVRQNSAFKIRKSDIRKPDRSTPQNISIISTSKPTKPKSSGSVFGLELDFLEKIGLG